MSNVEQRSGDYAGAGEDVQRLKENLKAGGKPELAIDPAVEKPLLSLHATINIGSFWRAVQQLLSTAMPNRLIGLMLQPNPILPMIARWTLPMADGFFTAEPLKSYVAAQQRRRFVRISDLFSNRTSFMKSAFYRRYMAPQRCAHGIGLFFWKRQRLICVIAIMRTATQGGLSPTEMKLLQHLYPQFLTALCRLRSLEREHSLRMDLEEFLSRLPMPTILLRWNLKLIYQNQAAREFCALWEKGTEEAKQTKATSPIPSEILNRCRLLKQQWADAQRPIAPLTGFKEERVHHPRSPHLRATVHLKQLSSAGVARPHFLIECEDLRSSAPRSEPACSCLPHLVRLTRREQEIARLVCEGRSNQEVADNACLSLPMVKKHLHAVFRKLEVPSRSRLMTLMR
ncbi:MAG TPA: LuxR C-terminal-related transcriptional regulator [Candidatus Dormibacteraeota bacterium]|nr:LuxR C-terminal-related transcriptional regulator [Candidatus Dormibacteraeota bacterium]